ncbi:lipase family protein [Nocardia fluminea]|uniref:lipase family protein n=1 Tax=Nocardia fluminea TaxID=134984 RepID=UPI003D14D244
MDFIQIDQMFVVSGHAIPVPDWEGPKRALFTPRQRGYAALDRVRAAQSFAPLGLSGTPGGGTFDAPVIRRRFLWLGWPGGH